MTKSKGKRSDLETNILFLENKPLLCPYEKLQLNNLKERQNLLKGVTGETNVENEKETESIAVDEPKNVKLKLNQSFPGAFLLYRSDKMAKVREDDPHRQHAFGKKFALDDWNNMSYDEKKVYHDKAAGIKHELGDRYRQNIKAAGKTYDDKKESKKIRNKKYQEKMKAHKRCKEEAEVSCKIKYAEILQKRQDKLDSLKAKREQLALDISAVEIEISIVEKLTVEKEREGFDLKEKYQALYKIHKSCVKSKK